VSAFQQVGLSAGNGFAWSTLDQPVKRGLTRAIEAGAQIVDPAWASTGESTNGWKCAFVGGRAGHDLALRAALAKYELGAQLSDQGDLPQLRGGQLQRTPPRRGTWRCTHPPCCSLKTNSDARASPAHRRSSEAKPDDPLQLAARTGWRVQPDHASLRIADIPS
jgi:hypothetical protein